MSPSLACHYPVDYQKCIEHRLANRIFKGLSRQSIKICDCCGKRIGQSDLKVSCCQHSIKQLAILGPGVPILFIFIQNGILLLLQLVAVLTLYGLVSNIIGNSCSLKDKCVSNIFNRISIVNKSNDPQSVEIQSYLVMTYTLLYNILLQFLIYRIRKKQYESDEGTNSPSDYSIIIRGLPQKCTIKQIKQLIEERRRCLNMSQRQYTNNLSIHDIEMSYPLDKYLQQIKKQKQRYILAIKNGKSATYQIQKIQNPKATKQTSSFAIVIFNKQYSKQMFETKLNIATQFVNRISKTNNFKGIYKIRDHRVYINRAPEPDDIIWQNSDITYWMIVKNKLITHFLGLIILTIGGIAQYYLQLYSKKVTNQNIEYVLSFLSSLTMAVINLIIAVVLQIVTSRQRNWTLTKYNTSILNKICLFSFFNTGIFYPVATILATQIQNFNFQAEFSFQIMLFIIINSLSPTLLKIIFTKIEFPNIILQYFFRKKYFFSSYTQQEANNLFQMPQISFPELYAYVIKTLWLTCLYSPLVPIVVPISIIGLVLFYFSEKYLFATAYCQPKMLSIDIAQRSIFLLNFTPLLISLGQIAVAYYIKSQLNSSLTVAQQVPLFLSLVFSGLAIFLPSKKISQKIKTFGSTSRQQLYEKAVQQFQITYKIANPITAPGTPHFVSEIHMLKFLKLFNQTEMKMIKQINNNLRNPLLKDIQNQDL